MPNGGAKAPLPKSNSLGSGTLVPQKKQTKQYSRKWDFSPTLYNSFNKYLKKL